MPGTRAILFFPLLLIGTAQCIAYDGEVDTSFGISGSNSIPANTENMVSTAAGEVFLLRTLHLEKLDSQGTTIASTLLSSLMSSIALAPNGDVLVSRADGNSPGNSRIEVCRFNSALLPQPWLATNNHCVSIPIAYSSNLCMVTSSVATQSQIFVGGNCPNSFIAAFTFDGEKDERFGGGLIQGVWDASTDSLVTLLADPDGSGVMAGGSTPVTHEFGDGSLHRDLDFAVTAISMYGEPRTSFALTGKRTLGFDDLAAGNGSDDRLVFLGAEQNRLVLMGTSRDDLYSGSGIKRVVALDHQGNRDLGFGQSAVLASISSSFRLEAAIADTTNGYFLVGSTTDPAVSDSPFVKTCLAVHLGLNGQMDLNFGGGLGYSEFRFPHSPTYVRCPAVVMQGNQPVIAQTNGFVEDRSAIGRLTVDHIFAGTFEEGAP